MNEQRTDQDFDPDFDCCFSLWFQQKQLIKNWIDQKEIESNKKRIKIETWNKEIFWWKMEEEEEERKICVLNIESCNQTQEFRVVAIAEAK